MSSISSVAAVTQLTDAIRTNFLRRANLNRQDARVASDVLQEATDQINSRREDALDGNQISALDPSTGVAASATAPLGLVEFEQFLSSVGKSTPSATVPTTTTPTTTRTPLALLDSADLVALRLSSDVSAFGIQSATIAATLQSEPTSNVVPLRSPDDTLAAQLSRQAIQAGQSPEVFNRTFAIPASVNGQATSTPAIPPSTAAIQAALAAQPLTQQGNTSQETLLAKYGLGQRQQGGPRGVIPNERRRRSSSLDFEAFE